MPTKKARSIQGDGHKRGGKSYAAKMNARAMRKARRHGMRWDGEDVKRVVTMRLNDEKIIDMAEALERSFYATQVACSHAGFYMRNKEAFDEAYAEAGAKDELAARRKRATRKKTS